MSVLSTIIACLVGAVIGIVGAYYYTIWKTKKVMEGLMSNLGNLKDPEARSDGGDDDQRTDPAITTY